MCIRDRISTASHRDRRRKSILYCKHGRHSDARRSGIRRRCGRHRSIWHGEARRRRHLPARRPRGLIRENRYGGDDPRRRRSHSVCRLRYVDRRLLTRHELVARTGVVRTRLIRSAALRIRGVRHDPGRPVFRPDDRRQRRQHRTAEHGAIRERARSAEHRQTQNRRNDDETAAPASVRGVVLVVLERILIFRSVLLLIEMCIRDR